MQENIYPFPTIQPPNQTDNRNVKRNSNLAQNNSAIPVGIKYVHIDAIRYLPQMILLQLSFKHMADGFTGHNDSMGEVL